MWLLDEHIQVISKRLTEGGVKDGRLHADLLDHICSYLEEQEGDDFDVLLQQSFHLLAPNGVHEIEEERFFLFHFHKQLTMKKILFFSGFATTFLLTTGFTFKQLHWPGANVLLTIGNFGLIVTILLIASNGIKQASNHTTAFNVRIFTGVIAAMLIAVGSIFKLFHFPTANIQFVLGILLLNFVFLPLFFYQLYKQSVSRSN
jgi:hypothetical protein